MRMNNLILRILSSIKMRWYIIIVCVCLCSGGLVVEKTYFTPALPQSDSMYYMKVVKFADEGQRYDDGNNVQIVTITPVIHMWGNEEQFIKLSQNEFDYEKFCKGWNNRKTLEKIQWLEKHIYTNYMGAGVYEFVLAFSTQDAKDSDYVNENGKKYLESYVQYAKSVSSIIIDTSNLHSAQL